MTKNTWFAPEVVAAIRKKYADKQRFAVFEQVANGTGMHASSWIDVVVVSLWPSDGLVRRAFEVKVTRADFTRELAIPKKNAWAKKAYHEFYYATAPGTVKSEDEIPEGCGWYLATKAGLRIKKAARRKDDVYPYDAELLIASLARSAQAEAADSVQRAAKDALEHSDAGKRAVAYEQAVKLFFKEHNAHSYFDLDSPDGILTCLRRAIQPEAQKKEIDAITWRLGAFEEKMLGLFWEFAAMAHIGLTERDDIGQLISEHFGYFQDDPKIQVGQRAKAVLKKQREARAIMKDCAEMRETKETPSEKL